MQRAFSTRVQHLRNHIGCMVVCCSNFKPHLDQCQIWVVNLFLANRLAMYTFDSFQSVGLTVYSKLFKLQLGLASSKLLLPLFISYCRLHVVTFRHSFTPALATIYVKQLKRNSSNFHKNPMHSY